jgi:hypothetical protein
MGLNPTELRELDAAVAIHVFGWAWMRRHKGNKTALIPPDTDQFIRWNFNESSWEPSDEKAARFQDWDRVGGLQSHRDARGFTFGPWATKLPPFSTNIEAAWMVVEYFRSFGERDDKFRYFVDAMPYTEDAWDLMFRLSPEIICQAAVQSLTVK